MRPLVNWEEGGWQVGVIWACFAVSSAVFALGAPYLWGGKLYIIRDPCVWGLCHRCCLTRNSSWCGRARARQIAGSVGHSCQACPCCRADCKPPFPHGLWESSHIQPHSTGAENKLCCMPACVHTCMFRYGARAMQKCTYLLILFTKHLKWCLPCAVCTVLSF